MADPIHPHGRGLAELGSAELRWSRGGGGGQMWKEIAWPGLVAAMSSCH